MSIGSQVLSASPAAFQYVWHSGLEDGLGIDSTRAGLDGVDSGMYSQIESVNQISK